VIGPKELSFVVPDISGLEHSRTIAAYEWGEASAPRTVLCLHGLTRNGRDFDFLAQALLAEGLRVISLDMPGRGKSPWLASPAGYNNAAYVADITYILDALKLEQVDWVGTSMGGIIAMMLAAAAPQRIGKLVLNDVGAVISAAGLERIFAYAGTQLLFATRAEAEAAMRNIFAPFGITQEAHWQHMFTHSLIERSGRHTLAYDPGIIASLPRPPEGVVQDVVLWPFMAPLLTTPTLLVRGSLSDLLTAETAQAMKAQMPRLTLHEVPGAGHAPSLMDAHDISVIANWLKQG
jgi:pimeloyl-ACP methyl ester carboxylesterase